MTDHSVDALGRLRKTHCIHGHKFDEDSAWSVNWRGYKCRVCRECGRIRIRRKREKPGFKQREAEKAARWRKAHPVEYKAAYTQANDKKKQVLLDARRGGCIKCGETHPACLDFHHRNGKSDKLGHIGVVRRFAMEKLLAEIAKCDVLCANCHRKHHYDERHAKPSVE